MNKQIKQLCSLDENEIFVFAKNIGAPLELVEEVRARRDPRREKS